MRRLSKAGTDGILCSLKTGIKDEAAYQYNRNSRQSQEPVKWLTRVAIRTTVVARESLKLSIAVGIHGCTVNFFAYFLLYIAIYIFTAMDAINITKVTILKSIGCDEESYQRRS